MFFDDTVKRLLQHTKKIAIIGAKDKEGQPVDMVGRYLLSAGYTVYPVHNMRKSVWGLSAYKDIASLPEPVDIINLFRAAPYCVEHAREVLALSWQPQCFWMQVGIRQAEASKILAAKNIKIIEDLCIKTEHERLLGN